MPDGYIFVIQNLRGRFKSEGTFKLTSQVNLADSTSTNETTDAYDSIDWLVKNVANNNGKVGMYGVSYDGLTTAHGAAASASRAQGDQRAGDARRSVDERRRASLRRAARELRVRVRGVRAGGQEQEHAFRLRHLRQLLVVSRSSARSRTSTRSTCTASIPYWNDIVAHPDYDEFWKKEAWVNQLHASTVPNLNVAGFWDQEDPWGPWQIFRHAAEHDPDHTNFMVAGPWYHGAVAARRRATASASCRTAATRRRANFARRSRRRSSATISMAKATKPAGARRPFSRAPTRGARTTRGRRRNRSPRICICTPTARSRSRSRRRGRAAYREYVSDPANPVPYRQRPISPTYPEGDWRTLGGRRSALRRWPPRRAELRERAARSRSHGHRARSPRICSRRRRAPMRTSSSS